MGAAIGLVALLVVTGPVGTLDVTHTPIAWAGATAWGLMVFWAARMVPGRWMRGLAAVGRVAIAVAVVGFVGLVGSDQVTPAPRVVTLHFVLVATIIVGAIALVLGARGHIRAPGMSVLVVAVVALFVLFDLGVVKRDDALRDLRLYLLAGERFGHGMQPYTLDPLHALLADQSAYPFLYPPVVLPAFRAMAGIPYTFIAPAWTAMCLGLGVAGLQILGVRGVWAVVLVLWPPFFEGLWVGNVAVPAFLLLVASFRSGRWLLLGPLLKVQAAIPPLWLLRERRWRELAIGMLLVAVLCLTTLPMVGLHAWFDWVAGLRAFQETERVFPVLYTFALPRVVPYAVFLAMGIVAVGWAITGRGPIGLARMGVAAIVISPSVYRHGLLMGLPAIVALDAQFAWLALGLPLTFWGLWIAVAIAALGTSGHLPRLPVPYDGHPAPAGISRVPTIAAADQSLVPSIRW